MQTKHAVFALLVAQNSSLVLLMRHSRASPAAGEPYLVSVAVLLAELLKLAICCVAIGPRSLPQQLHTHLVERWWETLKVGVPALLYTGQNYLLFIALSNLDAATFQVLYQLKTLFTALFSVMLLGKCLSLSQWLGLAVLTIGVIAVRRPDLSAAGSQHKRSINAVGLGAVVAAAASSGFASVYFEKMLKPVSGMPSASLWVRNVQLGLFALPTAALTALFNDGAAIREHGLLSGFGGAAVGVVMLNAAGGLLVAAVIKYADNIVKTFATVISIILSALLSVPLFGLVPSAGLLQGLALVCISVVLYSRPSKSAAVLSEKASAGGDFLSIDTAGAHAAAASATMSTKEW
ncbi:nucleotide-sugar transporter-domain-containing protein [Pavlovales sp. CCMP2436]|nr:nucleotide-sugar transporter-domain-containing protein [Pavlovales sp. CCMP2436]|mmetsp:Transcript_32640/g.81166  ORF Transcript_32640/g.81166 Transcript_32640/m.81166 type:complete len:349 (-) Transcript_32640:108-1154(-)